LVVGILNQLRSVPEPVESILVAQIAQYFALTGDLGNASNLLVQWSTIFKAGINAPFRISFFEILCQYLIPKLGHRVAHDQKADSMRQQLLDLHSQLIRVHRVRTTPLTTQALLNCGIRESVLRDRGIQVGTRTEQHWQRSSQSLSSTTDQYHRKNQHQGSAPQADSSATFKSQSKSSATPFSSF
jgi:hypothetical protein